MVKNLQPKDSSSKKAQTAPIKNVNSSPIGKSPEQEIRLNKVIVKIVLSQTQLGISNLQVVLYDVDPATRPEDFEKIVASIGVNLPTSINGLGDRIGSRVTDKGLAEFEFEDREFQIRNANEKRPDLLLIVLSPEALGRTLNSRLLYFSFDAINAGRTESYLIELTADQLEKVGVPLPSTPPSEVEDAQKLVERLTKANVRLETLDNGLRQLDQQQIERLRTLGTQFHENIKPRLRRQLSRFSEVAMQADDFVTPEQSVFEKSSAVIRSDIEKAINNPDPKVHPPITGSVALTEEQLQMLKSKLSPKKTISEQALKEVMGPQAPSIDYLQAIEPLEEFCRKSAKDDECLKFLENSQNEEPDESQNDDHSPDDVPGVGIDEITDADIKRYVARLMETMTSPEEELQTGLEPRATDTSVQERVRNISIEPSPADTTAFYDFHNLQIALRPVWEEFIDEGILDLAEDAYHDIVELGGTPDPNPNGASKQDSLLHLLHEGRLVMTSRRVTRDHVGETIIRDHRGQVEVRDHRGKVIIRDHRGQAGGTARHPIGPRPGSVYLPPHPADRLPEILAELEKRLKEDYAFTVYAANRKERSINFGILLTYRQRWQPLAYQAGRLVKTITLAPREVQRYSKKTTVRRKRAEKEVEHHLRSRHEEISQTTRAEQDIVRKATLHTNFSLTSQDSLNVPVAEGITAGSTRTTTFQRDASKTSEDIKKSFHEAVFKAAQEYKDEFTVEINTEESEEVEIVESGEISNPNDEVAVAFLFYELQRRYRVSERIDRGRAVVLVAQEMPRPDEIDEAWLIANDWILRRVILDDSLVPALNYLSTAVVGDEVALKELLNNVTQHRRLVDELQSELTTFRDRLSAQRALFEQALFKKAGVITDKKESSSGGGFSIPIISDIPVVGDVVEGALDVTTSLAEAVGSLGEYLFGSDAGTGTSRLDAMKDAIERTAEEARDILFRLEREVTALNAASEKYAEALADHYNHKAQIDRLRAHVKQNILYYMQAIWSHEPPDQRFFRLHDVPIPILEAANSTYTFNNLIASNKLANLPHRNLGLHGPAKKLYDFQVHSEVQPELQFTTLAQAADIDTLIGFKGNYMIFPLRESNALTDAMLKPYVVAGFNELVDPDDLGNWTLDEFADYVCCLHEKLSQEQFETIRETLFKQYQRLLSAPRRGSDVITVPTRSLFIEALPAGSSLMEKFKEKHRMLDVKMAQAHLRNEELRSVRAAARLLTGDFEDPDIEKKIVIQGDTATVIDPSSEP